MGRRSPARDMSVALTVGLCLAVVSAASCLAQEPEARFERATALYQDGRLNDALAILVELDGSEEIDEQPLIENVRRAHVSTLFLLGKAAQATEDWQSAREFYEQLLTVLERPQDALSSELIADLETRRYWTYKNMVLACHGLKDLDAAATWREKLYQARRDELLPTGLDEYFNFDFFRHESLNIWGYEYYPELGDPETEGSFSKYVYFVYDTNEDGTDKDQLFRLHVLKFHKLNPTEQPDFVLTARRGGGAEEASRTLYDYTYNTPVDFEKLRSDIEKLVGEYAEQSSSEDTTEDRPEDDDD